MAININELSLTVKGNIVKNNDTEGNSVLRMTQEQAQEIYADLGDFLSKNAGQVSLDASKVVTGLANLTGFNSTIVGTQAAEAASKASSAG